MVRALRLKLKIRAAGGNVGGSAAAERAGGGSIMVGGGGHLPSLWGNMKCFCKPGDVSREPQGSELIAFILKMSLEDKS